MNMELPQELGYKLDREMLIRCRIERDGHPPTEGIMNFYESAAPFIVMAYQEGVSGNKLSELFPYLLERRAEG